MSVFFNGRLLTTPSVESAIYDAGLAAAYPGRRVVTVDARELFARGGGVHCITQQQPARKTK